MMANSSASIQTARRLLLERRSESMMDEVLSSRRLTGSRDRQKSERRIGILTEVSISLESFELLSLSRV
jgi:hypothetical protein